MKPGKMDLSIVETAPATEIELQTTIQRQSCADFPEIPRKQVIASFPSGEIRIETGADGAWLLFDCDCTDALPYCKAQCCALKGTSLHPEEEALNYDAVWDEMTNTMVLRRDADGFCTYLDRSTRRCEIYVQRPQTCRDFHCSRGGPMRGFKLSNAVHRQSNH